MYISESKKDRRRSQSATKANNQGHQLTSPGHSHAVVWTKSQVQKAARQILGPKARLQEKNGLIYIGMQTEKGFLPLNQGKTYLDVIINTFLKPLEARETFIASERNSNSKSDTPPHHTLQTPDHTLPHQQDSSVPCQEQE